MQSWKRVPFVAPLTAALVMGGGAVDSAAGGQDVGALVRYAPAATGEIGVSVRDVGTADAERARLTAPEGAVVDRVAEDGPAAAAGIAAGDVIIEFDRERVRGARQLARVVAETPVGRSVSAVVMREGQRLELSVTPREGRTLPLALADRLRDVERGVERLREFGGGRGDFRFAVPLAPEFPRFDFDGWGRPGRLGVRVQDLNPQLAEFFGVQDGVLVSEVQDNTPAAAAGLEAGDVVTSVNGTQVRTVSDLRRLLADVEAGGEITLVVIRERKEVSISAKLDDRRPARRLAPRAVIPL